MGYWTDIPPFNPAAEYIVRKPIWLDGKVMQPGAAVPKTRYAHLPNRLKQLYEQRWIDMVLPTEQSAEDALAAVKFDPPPTAAKKKRGRPPKAKA